MTKVRTKQLLIMLCILPVLLLAALSAFKPQSRTSAAGEQDFILHLDFNPGYFLFEDDSYNTSSGLNVSFAVWGLTSDEDIYTIDIMPFVTTSEVVNLPNLEKVNNVAGTQFLKLYIPNGIDIVITEAKYYQYEGIRHNIYTFVDGQSSWIGNSLKPAIPGRKPTLSMTSVYNDGAFTFNLTAPAGVVVDSNFYYIKIDLSNKVFEFDSDSYDWDQELIDKVTDRYFTVIIKNAENTANAYGYGKVQIAKKRGLASFLTKKYTVVFKEPLYFELTKYNYDKIDDSSSLIFKIVQHDQNSTYANPLTINGAEQFSSSNYTLHIFTTKQSVLEKNEKTFTDPGFLGIGDLGLGDFFNDLFGGFERALITFVVVFVVIVVALIVYRRSKDKK